MADTTPQFPDPSANNADVVKKLEAQDAAGKSTAVLNPVDAHATEDALDALVKQVTPPEEGAAPPENTPAPVTEDPAKKAAEDAAAAKTAEEAAVAKAVEEAGRKKADDLFKDSPALPQGASTKSVEAFSSIKLKAAQEISKLEDEVGKLRAQVKEQEERAKQPSPEAQQKDKELEDLRAWRARLDVDFDPKFKDFDKKVSTTQDFIYDLLKKSPVVSDAVIEQIKKFGGPENSNLTKVFEAMKDPTLQKLIENKIADIAALKFEKSQAVKEAKGNIQQWMTERQQATAKEHSERAGIIQNEVNGLMASTEWAKDKTIDPKSSATDQAAAKAHNDLMKQVREELSAVLTDDSPRTKAILLTGIAKLTWLNAVHEATVKELATAREELTKAQALIQKIKTSSTSRLRESAAPVSGKLPEKPKDIFNTHATDALDTLAKQITEQRQAAGQ